MHGVQVKLCYPLTMRAIPERLRDSSRGGAIQIDDLYLLPLNSTNRNMTSLLKVVPQVYCIKCNTTNGALGLPLT